MLTTPPDCIRCDVPMTLGFVIDKGHKGHMRLPTWVEGIPEHSMWSGIALGNREEIKVFTYRCPECGYLESYAN